MKNDHVVLFRLFPKLDLEWMYIRLGAELCTLHRLEFCFLPFSDQPCFRDRRLWRACGYWLLAMLEPFCRSHGCEA